MGRDSKGTEEMPEIERKSAKKPEEPKGKSKNVQKRKKITRETWTKIIAIGIVALFVLTAFGVAIAAMVK